MVWTPGHSSGKPSLAYSFGFWSNPTASNTCPVTSLSVGMDIYCNHKVLWLTSFADTKNTLSSAWALSTHLSSSARKAMFLFRCWFFTCREKKKQTFTAIQVTGLMLPWTSVSPGFNVSWVKDCSVTDSNTVKGNVEKCTRYSVIFSTFRRGKQSKTYSSRHCKLCTCRPDLFYWPHQYQFFTEITY